MQDLLNRIERLGQELAAANRARRREVFRFFVSRIDLSFGRVERGKRTGCPFESGQIHLCTGEDDIFGSVSRGDWHSFEPLVAKFVDAALAAEADLSAVERLLARSA